MVDRRGFLKGSAAAVSGGLVAPSLLSSCAPAPTKAVSTGPGGEAGIDHIVVLMMENRSFDHFLGWLPGADGKQAGLSFADPHGNMVPTHHLTHFASCEYRDPDHGYAGGRRELNGGTCDGFMLASPDTLPVGYYEQDDLFFFGKAAPAWTVCDRYFAATMGPTFPNRMFQHTGRTDRITNTLAFNTHPAIWDRVSGAGLQGRYYFSDAPFSALFGLRFANISRPIEGFYADCKEGLLPNLSFVDPRFLIPPFGSSGDDHPSSDIRVGEKFIKSIYDAVTSGPGWERTVLVVNFDEWGGFYDHVTPEVAPDDDPNTALRGFRLPNVIVSPLARRGYVDHQVYDHASVLKMVEWAWDLEPLAMRDAQANNLADALDLNSSPNYDVPQWHIPDFIPYDCFGNIVDDIFGPVLHQGQQLGIA